MYASTTVNKNQAFELIQRYLHGEVYTGSGNIFEKYPYNREENQKFLHHTFPQFISMDEIENIKALENPFYGSTANVWLSRNERMYEIKESDKEECDNNGEKIAHHLRVANEKLRLLEIKDRNGKIKEYKNHIQLINFFELLKKDKEKYDANIFADLEFQVTSIKDLLKTKKVKEISKIKIYHELEPLKIAMMGNWVDGSCLSYYSTVGNYWSAITNALEVNKGVFYIEEEHGNVIARVLVGIDGEHLELDIHPMYLKGNIDIDLQKYFDIYISELAGMLEFGTEGKRGFVKLLFCEKWYDGD